MMVLEVKFGSVIKAEMMMTHYSLCKVDIAQICATRDAFSMR